MQKIAIFVKKHLNVNMIKIKNIVTLMTISITEGDIEALRKA